MDRITSRDAALTLGFGALCVLGGCASSGPEIAAGRAVSGETDGRGVAFGTAFDGTAFFGTGPSADGETAAAANAAASVDGGGSDAVPADGSTSQSGETNSQTREVGWDAGAVSLGAGFVGSGGASGGERNGSAAANAQPVSFGTEGGDFDPSVSEDGFTVVFASTRHSQTADIYRKRIGGTSVVQLTNDAAHDVMPAVSPDGTRVAFASDRDGSWDIFVVGIEGGPAVQVTDGVSSDLHPTWSPDGRTIAFCRMTPTGERWEIWTARVDQPATTRYLTDGMFPVWQPGGSKIAYQRSRNRGTGQFTVWTVDVVDGEAHRPTEVIASNKGAVINPAWSHDGERLAFSTVLRDDQAGDGSGPERADLWVQHMNGAGRVNLTGGNAVNLMPAWGPEGEVFFVTNRSGRESIWSIPAETFPGRSERIASELVPLDRD